MLPPTAESSSTPKVETRWACWRVRAAAQAARPRPAAMAATRTPVTSQGTACGPTETP